MDPNAKLEMVRHFVKRFRQVDAGLTVDPDEIWEIAEALTGHVEALDESLSKGGRLPSAWERTELSFDEAESRGLDGTGRDGDPRFPHVG